MRAGAFVRRSGAAGLGHVGWTFQYPDGSFCDGAVENPAGTPMSPPGQTGFWTQTVVDPDPPMKLRAYDAFKLFEIPTGNPDQADKTVAWIGLQPYLVIFRNCMDDTYDVLRSYGIPDLPMPMARNHPQSLVRPAQSGGATGDGPGLAGRGTGSGIPRRKSPHTGRGSTRSSLVENAGKPRLAGFSREAAAAHIAQAARQLRPRPGTTVGFRLSRIRRHGTLASRLRR